MGGEASRYAESHSEDDALYSDDRYHGAMSYGWRHGKGTYLYNNGDVYSGDWVFNVRTGWGVYMKADNGEKYEGQWRNGLRHGLGTNATSSGVRVFGEFADDRRSGTGLAVHKSGDIYVEEYLNGIQISSIPFHESLIPSSKGTRSTSSDSSGPAAKFDFTNSTVSDVSRILQACGLHFLVENFARNKVDGFAFLRISKNACSPGSFEDLGIAENLEISTLVIILARCFAKLKLRKSLARNISADFINPEALTLKAKIATGGFGGVYRARWLRTQVAVKLYHGGESSRDFEAEVHALSRLSHPNIAMLLGVVHSPRFGILLEFVSCGSLFDLLHKRGKIPGWGLRRILSIAQGVASGMAHAHFCGVWHCDLKSSNLLLTESWTVKICDFGLAFVPDNSQKNGAPLGLVGTFQWTAPEVLRGEEFTAAADVYSFGAILWEMLSRRVPFGELSGVQVVGLVGYGGRKLPELRSGLPVEIVDLVRACTLEKRPSFVDVAEILGKLDDASFDVEESLDAFFSFSRHFYSLHFSISACL